ncbi:hypothetical protein Moror_6168 [Moniliophthora roreri MCA 2997]|uniref:Uncharacterized protein n=2 Tax=Moniliophthora roreri TaxID=221103 RepID=V2WCD9_MONRO|nr:hypothetical protein Moror_6168 [Moniliophthora roreri MCA 2997]KAI3616189.1 hypothetical protein WG66_014127 [Moniliophthora roreri]
MAIQGSLVSGEAGIHQALEYTGLSINAFPVELLTEIFLLCRSTGRKSDPSTPTLANIISVCRYWRSIALELPYLWSTIALYDPRDQHARMVEQWLTRSKACPLTLIVRHAEDSAPDATQKIITLAMKHLRRWKKVLFSFLSVESITSLSDLPADPTAAPALEHVEISTGTCFDPEVTTKFWESIFTYPSARRTIWTSPDIDDITYFPCIPGDHWERLTHITAPFVLDDDLLDCLSRCNALEVLQIEDLIDATCPLRPRESITLPSLHTFKARGEGTVINRLLDYLTLPSVHDLDANLLFGGGLQSWIDLFHRSSCHLSRMKVILDEETSEKELHSLLSSSSMTELEGLCAAFYGMDTILVQKLICTTDNAILPILERLELRLVSCEDGLLSRMMESRRASLKYVDIVHYPPGYGNRSPSTDSAYFSRFSQPGTTVSYRGV